MTDWRLPPAVQHNPTCGACHGEIEHDGDSFRCDDCKLIFDSHDLTAEFADEEDDACGAECDNDFHGLNRINPGYSYDCTPCILPKGHNDDHYTDCGPRKVDDE